MQSDSRLQPFEAYLGKIVLHAGRLHFVKEVRIQRQSVHFVIRNEDGDEEEISTTALLDGLLEEVEPQIYEFMNPADGGRPREADSVGRRPR